ncbi:MBL fold metallo-hydrolase [Leeia aquatica]|uniref:MBL fold metallo-hydrolase n=1 Tax=Leeia aquatica TaxID=2725557 RepID=A0A847RW14_9NEIS|nr:MBL fold metallo-hydrolase [Leeia aquatica]NLR75370.1 MBL fold metallo-hydrolase [Leeia aquatica]
MQAVYVTRIPILPLGLVNAHLIHTGQGCILVDSGLPGSSDKIERALRKQGMGLRDIRLIVITHAHVDHAGEAWALRERCHAPILAHAGDLPYYHREQPMTFCATGWFGRVFLKTGLMYQSYPAFTPDILLQGDDTFDLTPYGIAGTVIPTPGHTQGSLSVVLQDRQALVGDLLASGILLGGVMWHGRPKQPPFEDDPVQVGTILQGMLADGMERFYIGHGGPLDAAAVARHSHRLL